MKKLFGLNLLLVVLFLLWACTGAQKDGGTVIADASAHPEMTEQEMLIPCFECHQEATPDIYTEWYDSLHGIGMVKCYQCHGTFENMKTQPEASDCMVCHVGQMEKCMKHDDAKDKKCSSCHNTHTFKLKTT